jgi:hypothetical protein
MHEICATEAQNLHIAAIYVTMDLMAIVFTQRVGMCMISLQAKFPLPVSSGLLAFTIIMEPEYGLRMDSVLFYI